MTHMSLPERGLCAHRGAMATHPENTLASFREAIRLGAHMIEFDLRLTSDKAMVLMHDASVDRTTNGTGNVADLTLAELKALDAGGWMAPAFAGEQVPTFEEALAVMPRNIWLNVELKGGGELGERAAQAVADAGRLHQAFLACKAEAASAARAAELGVLICNMERQGSSWDYVNDTIAMQCDFIQIHGPFAPEMAEFTPVLKKEGIRINYFGTDSPDELRQLFAAGIEFPLVNTIGALMAVAQDLSIIPAQPAPRVE